MARAHGRFTEHVDKIPKVVFVVFLGSATVVAFAWLETRLPTTVSPECAAAYARAESPEDSARVDQMMVADPRARRSFTCGLLRLQEERITRDAAGPEEPRTPGIDGDR